MGSYSDSDTEEDYEDLEDEYLDDIDLIYDEDDDHNLNCPDGSDCEDSQCIYDDDE